MNTIASSESPGTQMTTGLSVSVGPEVLTSTETNNETATEGSTTVNANGSNESETEGESKKPARKAKAKTAKKKAVKAAKAPKESKPKKSDIVREIMADKANKKLERKELLALIQKKAKLSKAAANTYMYQYR